MSLDIVALEQKERHLEKVIGELESVIVAYSGGVDSSLLAYYARRILGTKAQVVIALSASLAQEELDAARAQAQQFWWDLQEIETNELDNEDYARNDGMRCYFCKKTLFVELEELARTEGINHIVYGANVDDMQDYRPGHKAAREFSVLSPLQSAGLEKVDIRELAKRAGLPSWNRPQAACLSSRFPTFERVTIGGLSQVEQAEKFMHDLGFKQIRVRHYGDSARVEVDKPELPALLQDAALQARITDKLKSLGYSEVIIDPDGYRQGSANRLNETRSGDAGAGSFAAEPPLEHIAVVPPVSLPTE